MTEREYLWLLIGMIAVTVVPRVLPQWAWREGAGVGYRRRWDWCPLPCWGAARAGDLYRDGAYAAFGDTGGRRGCSVAGVARGECRACRLGGDCGTFSYKYHRRLRRDSYGME